MSRRDEQLARMKGLMTYGTTNTSKKTPITESIEGPDGNIYAIIREGSKYHIKSTPKGSELVAESFNYIGGFMNKKNNEYSSYNQASKNLELKIRSLNEAYGVNKTVEILNPEKKENLMVEMTDAMKASIARYRQIMNNTAGIMNESTISASNTGNPEAPKTTGFSPKLGEPFTDKAEAKLDTDLKSTANDPEKQGEPFGDNSKTEEYKDAQYVPDGSVANKKPSGGKVVRVNENEEYEETIEECEEWGSCGLPSAPGVGEVGDDAPFTDKASTTLEESDFFHNPDVADDEQLANTPDEVTIDESADEFVGFADDENISEGDDEMDSDYVDIDLDDIDSEEESDEIADSENELDDIDSYDVDSDDVEEQELESDTKDSEIEALRSEIESLRNLIIQKLGDEPNEVDVTDNLEDDDFEGEDDNLEDDDFEDEFDDMNESRQYIERLVMEAVAETEIPEVEVRYDHLNLPKRPYSLWLKLKEVAENSNASKEDMNIIAKIRGCLINMLEADEYLKEFARIGYDDTTKWEHFIQLFDQKLSIINQIVRKLSFMSKDLYDNLVQNELESLNAIFDRYYDKYEAMIGVAQEPENTDASIDDEDYEEHYDADDYYNNDEDEDDNIDFDIDFDPTMYESKKSRHLNEEGTKLNVFGKHPGYRKKPMSLPQTGSDRTENTRDWNDDSVYSEQPFGEKIGTSAPFDKIVNEIFERLKKKL